MESEIETLKRIKELETEAKKNVDEAEAKAAKLVEEAKRKAEEDILNAQKESEHRYEEAILQAKGKADKERKKIFTENTAKINRLGDIEKDKMLRVLDEVFRERI